MDKKTLKQMMLEIYSTSKKMTEEVLAAKLSIPEDIIHRSLVSRWKSGATLETGYYRHLRVIALHKRVMRRHNK
mgnify:CR=1 FL=1|tara:strand:- start:1019 stop:1240 length:222 start_codon:yes stop_codon:yes gene_type:complete